MAKLWLNLAEEWGEGSIAARRAVYINTNIFNAFVLNILTNSKVPALAISYHT
jgi:hypothetical protein